MKTWLPDNVAIDTLFRDKLEDLPVDLAGKAMHWQQVKQQMKAAAAHISSRNIPIGHIMGYTIAGLLLLTICIQQLTINHPTEETGQPVTPPIAPASPHIPETGHLVHDSMGQDTVATQPVAPQSLKAVKSHTGISTGTAQLPATGYRPSSKIPDTPATTPAHRKDSLRKGTAEGVKKDSVFIFW